MADPPVSSLAEHAVSDGGDGRARAKTNASTLRRSSRTISRPARYEFSDSSDNHSDPDFVAPSEYHASRGRKNNRSRRPSKPQQRKGQRQHQQPPGGQVKASLTQFDRAFYRLRDWVKTDAQQQTIIDLLSTLIKLARSAQDEDTMTFDRTFDATDPIELSELHALVIDQFKERNASVGKFKAWLKTICLRGLSDVSQRNSIRQPPPPVQRPAPNVWNRQHLAAWQPRALTKAEHDFLLYRDPLQTSRSSPTPLDGATRALLQVTAEQATQVTLVGQLDGSLRLSVASSFHSQLNLITDLTDAFTVENAALRNDIARIWYELVTNRLFFTMHSAAAAQKWLDHPIPILGRPVMLRRIMRAGDPRPQECIDLSLCHANLCNLGGNLSTVDIFHLFQSLLHLEVVNVDPLGPDADGFVDATQFHIAFRSRGCPMVLSEKTCVKWHDLQAETTHVVWIHFIHFKSTVPCTNCASSTHTFKNCQNNGTVLEENIVHVTGVRLDIEEDCANIQLSTNLEAELVSYSKILQERSAMAAEDFDAPAKPPRGHGKSIPNLKAPLGKAARIGQEACARVQRERSQIRREEALAGLNFDRIIRLQSILLAKDPAFPERAHRWRHPAPVEVTEEDIADRIIRAATPLAEIPPKCVKQQPFHPWTRVGYARWIRKPTSLQQAVMTANADPRPSATTSSSENERLRDLMIHYESDEDMRASGENQASPEMDEEMKEEGESDPNLLSGLKHERPPSEGSDHEHHAVGLGHILDTTKVLDEAIRDFCKGEHQMALLCPPRKAVICESSAIDKNRHPSSAALTVLQAVCSETHGLGNCLFAALIESSVNSTWAHFHLELPGIFERTMEHLKEMIYQAFMKDATRESTLCYRDLIQEQISETFSRIEAYTAYFTRIRTSPNSDNSILPQDTWGSSDVLRMFVKALGTRVYVIQHHPDARQCAFLVYERFTFADGFPTGMYKPLSLVNWIHDLGKQINIGTRPLVLRHCNQHYAAVLFPVETPDHPSAKRAAFDRKLELFPAPQQQDPYAEVETIDLTEVAMEEHPIQAAIQVNIQPARAGSEDSDGGPPLQLSHTTQQELAEVRAHGGSRTDELMAFLQPTQLSPLDAQREATLDQWMAEVTEVELSELARQRGNTSIEGAHRLLRNRLHAQLLDEQDADQDSHRANSDSSDSTYRPDESTSHTSDSEPLSDPDVPLAQGFHPMKTRSHTIPAATELEQLLRSSSDDPQLTLAQLLARPAALDTAFADIDRWTDIFSKLNHNIDFLKSLYPPLRQRWGLYLLRTIRRLIVHHADTKLSVTDPSKQPLTQWRDDIFGTSMDSSQDLLLTQREQVGLLVREAIPPQHRPWVAYLFTSENDTELARVALLCGLLAFDPSRPGDLLHWTIVVFQAVISSEQIRSLVLDDTLHGGLLALIEWVQQQDSVTRFSMAASDPWSLRTDDTHVLH